MNIHNINTIARYEVKLLRRSWLFRIFSVLAILGISAGILAFQTGIFSPRNFYWSKIALSSFMPFMAVYLYNIAQSIIAIFLAGNFLKRDKKLDTAEVIYVRPMSNADYVIGKVWGIIKVFLSLNAIILVITAFFNIMINQSPFDPIPYLFYLFTISLPSLLFVLGLSFTVMCIFKNQAITFVIMLGIIGTVFFKLSKVLHGAFDFFGVNIPSIFSDVTGHIHLQTFILQRIIFLLAGIGFICFTIALIKRLPHKPWKIIIVNSLGAFFLLLACIGEGFYIYHYENILNIREQYVQSYNRYADQPKAHILEHELTITPQNQYLTGKSKIKVTNKNSTDLQQVIFYLNPSLKVESVSVDQKNISFERDNQVILINTPLNKQQELTLDIHYAGSIDEKICYTDVSDSTYLDNSINKVPYQYGKRYAWLEEKFTLLTPECLWYPVTIPPVNPGSPYQIQRNFSRYQLTVEAPADKTILSQGESRQENGKTIFTSSSLLPGISLTIADYEKKSIVVDSVDYQLLYFKGHDYFSEHFNPIKDTIGECIQELKSYAENTNGKNYPFKKFVLAETPIQFATYVRNWKGYTEYVMPEIVFVPERGATLNIDFKAFKEMMQRSPRGMSMDDEGMARFLLSDFVRRSFLDPGVREGWNIDNQSVNQTDITPLFFNHVSFTHSEEFPIMDLILNSLQKNSSQRTFMMGGGGTWIMNDRQRANFYLGSHSFKSALSDQSLKSVIFNELLQLKSEELKNYISTLMPFEDFRKFMIAFFEKNRFNEASFDLFLQELNSEYDIDLLPYIQKWFTINKVPTLYVKDVDANQVVVEEETKYQIKFKINNPSDVDAIIRVEISGGFQGGRRGGGMSMTFSMGGSADNNEYFYTIPAKEAREVKIITGDQPSTVRIHTHISNNLPNTLSYNFAKIETIVTDTTKGIFNIDPIIFKPDPKSHEIIIDNESPNFKVIASNNRNKLKDLFQKEDEEKYSNFNWWQMPSKWTNVVIGYCYGEPICSAVYKCKGSGNNSVQWTADIPRGGYYEIAVWNPKNAMFGGRGGRGGRGREREERNQTYTIAYGEETESMTIDLERENNDWVVLGNFYLPKGATTITLTDDVSGHYVIADAVKFTRTDN